MSVSLENFVCPYLGIGIYIYISKYLNGKNEEIVFV